MMILWNDKKTNKHITLRFTLPSGCNERDVTATIQPGGRSVIVTYKWLEFMYNPTKFLEMYASPRTGNLIYTEDSAKSVAIAATVREMKGRLAGTEREPFTSVCEISLPFQVQEEFTTIRNKVGTHLGVEVMNVYHEERNVWVALLNLEMTGLASSYSAAAKTIPARAFRKPTPQKMSAIGDRGQPRIDKGDSIHQHQQVHSATQCAQVLAAMVSQPTESDQHVAKRARISRPVVDVSVDDAKQEDDDEEDSADYNA